MNELPKPYYEEPGIQIFCGDCREILPMLPDKSVALVLTDPPYGTRGLGGGYGRRRLHSEDGRNGRLIANDEDLGAIMGCAALIGRVMAEQSWLVAFCAARRMLETAQIFQLGGLSYFGHAIWDKGAPGLGYTIRYSHEDMLIFRRGEPDTPQDAVLSIIRHGVNRVDTGQRHPHEKPPEVWRHMARLHDGLILDPFAGTLGVAIAAKQLGRQCVCIELEEKYLEMGVESLAQAQLQFPDPKKELAELQTLWSSGHPDRRGIKQGIDDWIEQDAHDALERMEGE